MHEGKCSKEGSGPEPVSKEEWQGDRQTGGTAAEPCLKQNKNNIPETGSRILQTGAETVSRIGVGTASEQEQKHVPEQAQKQDLRLFLNLVHQESSWK